MEPALGVVEVAPLPALNRRFTTYRLDMEGAERKYGAQPATARAS